LGRVKALERIGARSFDSFTKLAAALCDAPVAYISLLDQEQEHFLARVGMEQPRLPLDESICKRAIEQDAVYVVSDIPQDGRFINLPTSVGVPNLNFMMADAFQRWKALM
jgi:GAF domain-containing protein